MESLNILLIFIILFLIVLIFNKSSEKFTDHKINVPDVDYPFINQYDNENKIKDYIILATPLYTPEDIEKYIFYRNLGLRIYFDFDSLIIPNVKFPFKNVFDDKDMLINVILISAPLYSEDDMQNYNIYKNLGLNMCGISSYQEFPDKIINPHEVGTDLEKTVDYTKLVTSWIYCSRTIPNAIKNSNMPKILLSEADLKNVDHYVYNPINTKEYDFIYICLEDNKECIPGWNWYIRSWELAKKCLEVMCGEFNLKGAIIGRTNCDFTDKCLGIVKVLPMLPFNEFQTELQKAKFIFAPNCSDASPRVLTEALCYNIPILVNYNIYGGWHNVISGVTGEFFTNEVDIKEALIKITTNNYTPREWYVNNRGLKKSGKELINFFKDTYSNLNNKITKYCYIRI